MNDLLFPNPPFYYLLPKNPEYSCVIYVEDNSDWQVWSSITHNANKNLSLTKTKNLIVLVNAYYNYHQNVTKNTIYPKHNSGHPNKSNNTTNLQTNSTEKTISVNAQSVVVDFSRIPYRNISNFVKKINRGTKSKITTLISTNPVKISISSIWAQLQPLNSVALKIRSPLQTNHIKSIVR
jgi:hypothetical protein